MVPKYASRSESRRDLQLPKQHCWWTRAEMERAPLLEEREAAAAPQAWLARQMGTGRPHGSQTSYIAAALVVAADGTAGPAYRIAAAAACFPGRSRDWESRQ